MSLLSANPELYIPKVSDNFRIVSFHSSSIASNYKKDGWPTAKMEWAIGNIEYVTVEDIIRGLMDLLADVYNWKDFKVVHEVDNLRGTCQTSVGGAINYRIVIYGHQQQHLYCTIMELNMLLISNFAPAMEKGDICGAHKFAGPISKEI